MTQARAPQAWVRLGVNCRVNQVIPVQEERLAAGPAPEGPGRATASFPPTNVRGKSNAAGEPHDPKQGRSGRATPKRRQPPGCRLVRRPASGSREVARRHIEQSVPRPRSVLHPNTRRRCSKLERGRPPIRTVAQPRNDWTASRPGLPLRKLPPRALRAIENQPVVRVEMSLPAVSSSGNQTRLQYGW
jgi:hypothetical protein